MYRQLCSINNLTRLKVQTQRWIRTSEPNNGPDTQSSLLPRSSSAPHQPISVTTQIRTALKTLKYDLFQFCEEQLFRGSETTAASGSYSCRWGEMTALQGSAFSPQHRVIHACSRRQILFVCLFVYLACSDMLMGQLMDCTFCNNRRGGRGCWDYDVPSANRWQSAFSYLACLYHSFFPFNFSLLFFALPTQCLPLSRHLFPFFMVCFWAYPSWRSAERTFK